MPVLDITYRPVSDERREALTRDFTNILLETFSCLTLKSIAIRFHEVKALNYAVGGKLVYDFDLEKIPAPFQIDIGWYAGKTQEQEQTAVIRLTESAARILRINPALVEISLRPQHRANHFVGGKRLDVAEPQ